MGGWDQRYVGFGGFPDALSPLEIEHFFTASAEEAATISGRRTPVNRMAFALQLGFLKMTGRTLNSVEIVPPAVLEYLGQQVAAPAPRIASIRAFYRRRRTLFDHQDAARQALGRGPLNDHAERGLTAYLRREAITTYDVTDLMIRARTWLVEHSYILPRERDLRRLAVAALRHQEQRLFSAISAAVPEAMRQAWVAKLAETREPDQITHLEWLGATPATRSTRSLEEQLKKVEFLRGLGCRPRLLRPAHRHPEGRRHRPHPGAAPHDRAGLLPEAHLATPYGFESGSTRPPDRRSVARRTRARGCGAGRPAEAVSRSNRGPERACRGQVVGR